MSIELKHLEGLIRLCENTDPSKLKQIRGKLLKQLRSNKLDPRDDAKLRELWNQLDCGEPYPDMTRIISGGSYRPILTIAGLTLLILVMYIILPRRLWRRKSSKPITITNMWVYQDAIQFKNFAKNKWYEKSIRVHSPYFYDAIIEHANYIIQPIHKSVSPGVFSHWSGLYAMTFMVHIWVMSDSTFVDSKETATEIHKTILGYEPNLNTDPVTMMIDLGREVGEAPQQTVNCPDFETINYEAGVIAIYTKYGPTYIAFVKKENFTYLIDANSKLKDLNLSCQGNPLDTSQLRQGILVTFQDPKFIREFVLSNYPGNIQVTYLRSEKPDET